MTRTTFTRLVQMLVATTALIGLLDAIGRAQKDLAIVLGFILALALVLVLQSVVGRRDVPVRRDLVRWMADRAACEGEEVGAIADRAIGAYRAGFVTPTDAGDEVGDAGLR